MVTSLSKDEWDMLSLLLWANMEKGKKKMMAFIKMGKMKSTKIKAKP